MALYSYRNASPPVCNISAQWSLDISKTLDAALAELQRQLSEENVQPLDNAYYEESHQRFEGVSNQRYLIREYLKAVIAEKAEVKGGPIEWLSIGCGAGHLDLPILQSSNREISRYVGIEPNQTHVDIFAESAADRENVTLIRSMLETASLMGTFDLITAIHVIYYADEPAAFVEAAFSHMKNDGTAVFAVAPLSPMNRIATLFWEQQSVRPIFADDLERLFMTTGKRFTRTRIDAAIPLSLYAGTTADRAVIDFTVQAPTGDLTSSTLTALETVFNAASVPFDDALGLEHPVDMFSVSGLEK
ncbi:MAG: methyltransferase domain-containing protein [Pseudomonadota bacterium]